MDEVRCPMCGKLNPEELDTCQYCQARLKPLNISSAPEEDAEITSSSASFNETPSQKKPPDQTPALPEWLQPDWLQSLRQGSGTDELGEIEPEDQLPDWSSEEVDPGDQETESAESSAPEDSSEKPDWLEGLRAANQAEPETPSEQDSESTYSEEMPEDEIPDWLQRIRARQSSDEPELPLEEPDAESAEFLAKLRMSPDADETDSSEQADAEEAQPGPDEEDSQVPDWLAEYAESGTESTPPELPDWLKSDELPAEPEDEEDSLAEFPSRMTPSQPPFTEPFLEEDIELESATELPAETPPDKPPFTEPVDEEEAEGEIADWLADLEIPAEQEEMTSLPVEDEEKTSFAFEAEPVEDQPDWLQDIEIKDGISPKEDEQDQDSELEVVAPFTLDEESADLIQEELPDWIKEIPAAEAQTEAEPSEEAAGELEPAELPTWLESMRPIESVAPSAPASDELDQIVESSGPLAGLQGILPAEPEIAREMKSPVYTVKLQVSENQQSLASRLAEMVKSEGIAAPIPRAPTISSQAVVRITLFLILLVSVVWPLYTGDLGAPAPELSPEVLDAQLLINALPDGGNVLLAIDYQPAYSGEMNATTASLLDHLMIKGAYLTLVSTSTTGPAQAEQLVRYVNNQMGHQYRDTSQYANLGYIGGGLSGLRSFAQSPQQIMPYALNASTADESTVWINGRLSNIQALSDFALTVVISDSPETARNWIEQVGPALEDTPLLLVVSAQAEPLVRPYYEGYPKQAKGLVVGLSGGVAYESSMPRPGIARRYWDAYSYGIPTAVFLILIGGLVNIVLAYLPTLKPGQGRAKR